MILSGSGEQLTAAACDTAGNVVRVTGGKKARGSRLVAGLLGSALLLTDAVQGAELDGVSQERPSRYRVTYLAGLGATSSAGNSMTTAVGWRASRTCRATVPVMPPCEGPGRSRPGHARRPNSAVLRPALCIVSIEGMLKLHLRPWI